jgi:hypothetical protein
MVPQNPESMPQDSLTHTQLGIPDSTPPENALKEAFLLARSLVSKRERRQGFEPSHAQMAGGGNVEPLLAVRQ